jgi:hypothetical protein
MVSCKKIADLIGAYIYGDLTPDEMRMTRMHMEECQSCAKELEFRSKTLALIPTETPMLSDEEKQRIMWTVRGAVREQSKPVRSGIFTPRFAWGVAASLILVAVFTGGAYVGFRAKKPKEKVITKYVTVPIKAPIATEKPENIVNESNTHTGPPIIPKKDQLTATGPQPIERKWESWRRHERNGGRTPEKPDAKVDEDTNEPEASSELGGESLTPQTNTQEGINKSENTPLSSIDDSSTPIPASPEDTSTSQIDERAGH